MKPSTSTSLRRRVAFTLIELLVVIAVIAILSSLLFPVVSGLKRKRMIAVAYAEMANVETAIESYKAVRGHYPPDNPANFVQNQLFFELKGTVLNNLSGTPTYVTLDGTGQIQANVAAFQSAYGATTTVQGFVNSSASAKGDDEKASAKNFLANLKPNQSGSLNAGSTIKFLTCSVLWDQAGTPPISGGGDPLGANPWRYISSNPTNNSTSYDLWVDLYIGGKTNRISNWSKTPQVILN